MDGLFYDNRIAGLILKFLQEDITEAERQELQTWIESSDRNREVFEELTNAERLPLEVANYSDTRVRMLEKIREAEPGTRVSVEMSGRFRWKPWIAAAVVIGLAVAGYWMFLKSEVEQQPVVVQNKPVVQDVAPGKDGAILKLADGRSIVLDDLQNGEVAKLGNVTVRKEGGKLVYKTDEGEASTLEYNTMSTPKGRTYRVELSEGTIVFLNAASSIRYPVVFAGNERRVEITGEAWFDVKKDASKKFIVETYRGSTEVLGTSFNINSYEDEKDVKITLLEGIVKVNGEKSTTILKPGQQALISEKSDASIRVFSADVDQVMAWKNGLFKFQSTPMQEMMRQIARWYDVEVVYEGAIKDDPVTGTMPRNTNASEALAILDYLGYKFTIDGKKITVKP